MLKLLILVLILSYLVFQILTTALHRQFLVPSQNWKDKILKTINYPKPIYLNVGTKRSSYRRRLVLASVQPSFYTNFLNNKIMIQPEDSKNEDGRFFNAMSRRETNDPKRRILYGFFHPYANNGGGGERVLWQAVKATLLADDRNIVVVYTTNTDTEPLQILKKVEDKFQVSNLDSKRITFIYLRKFGRMIDGDYWKHFTLIGQLFGSWMLSLEAMYELSPDIWVDTIGLPGSYLLVRLILKIPIMSYVHYPIIQPEMFNKLKFKRFSINELKNFSFGVRDLVELGKLIYWSMLYYFYMYLGSLVNITLTNGTWTFNHISNIWSINRSLGNKIEILFPPCATELLTKDAGDSTKRENKLLYIAQFRPEKRHSLILEEYSKFLLSFKSNKMRIIDFPTLVFLGSCRTQDDTSTLNCIKQQVKELELNEYVEFVVDCSYSEVINWLSKVKFGLNAMWNEHFGIGVVEYLSRGVIPLCHASAGPLLDIVTNRDNKAKEEGWHNSIGFFFKSESDPDFNESIQSGLKPGYLTFVNPLDNSTAIEANELIEYPSLSTLLTELFISQPESVSDEALAKMRSDASHLMVKNFSNQVFVTKWFKYVEEMTALERKYRDERRLGIEKVY